MFDINEIQKQFDEVLRFSQNLSIINSDNLFKEWQINKQFFIDAFDGNLTYTVPYKIHVPISDKDREALRKSFIAFLTQENPTLSAFVQFQEDGIFHNKVVEEYYPVKKDSKLIKAFKFFEQDPQKLRQYQDQASQLVQTTHFLEGYLTISVHPLDFLSISDNAHSWTSCHSLKGDYRAGNFALMTDSSTAICYLSSGIDREIKNFPFPWNSKKWRMLLNFSDDKNMVFANRQYPIENSFLLDLVYNEFLPKFGFDLDDWSGWQNHYIKTIPFKGFESSADQLIPVGRQYIPVRDLFITQHNRLFFNDYLYSSEYLDPYYAFKVNKYKSSIDSILSGHLMTDPDKTRFNLGVENISCLCCNERDIDYSDMIYCSQCCLEKGNPEDYPDTFGICKDCGVITYLENCEFIGDLDCVVCGTCAQDNYYQCNHCYLFYSQEGLEIDDEGNYICDWCKQDKEDVKWQEVTKPSPV